MPFAGYEDFDSCVSANSDKNDPSAYCGKIKHQVEEMVLPPTGYTPPMTDEAGTSAGAKKGWDTRGRGQKEPDVDSDDLFGTPASDAAWAMVGSGIPPDAAVDRITKDFQVPREQAVNLVNRVFGGGASEVPPTDPATSSYPDDLTFQPNPNDPDFDPDDADLTPEDWKERSKFWIDHAANALAVDPNFSAQDLGEEFGLPDEWNNKVIDYLKGGKKNEAKPLTMKEAVRMIREMKVGPMTSDKKMRSGGAKGKAPKHWTPAEFNKLHKDQKKIKEMGEPCPICGVPQESHMQIQDHPFPPQLPQENVPPPMPNMQQQPNMIPPSPPMPESQPQPQPLIPNQPMPNGLGNVRMTVSIPNSLSARSIGGKKVNEMLREIDRYL